MSRSTSLNPRWNGNKISERQSKITLIITISYFIFLLNSNKSFAEDLKISQLRIGNKEYQNATVIAENRFRAKIIHPSGIARISTSDLPPELQKQLKLIQIAPEPKPTAIFISQISDPKELATWFTKVATKEFWNVTHRITVQQSTQLGKLCKIGNSEELVLLLGDPKDRPDGAIFNATIKDLGRNFEYTTILGANKKVRIYGVQAPMTVEKFVNSVKNGSTYKIVESDQIIQCPTCSGKPITCKECESSGLITVDRVISIRWK